MVAGILLFFSIVEFSSPAGSDDRRRILKAAPLVIRESPSVQVKKDSHVIGKGKGIENDLLVNSPQHPVHFSPDSWPNDFEASSSSGLKLFVNRFGNVKSCSLEKDKVLNYSLGVCFNAQGKEIDGNSSIEGLVDKVVQPASDSINP